MQYKPPLVEVRHLSKRFPVRGSNIFGKSRSHVRAVDNVSLSIAHGETLGLVGESGCGKSTLGRVILHLLQPSAGQVLFEGIDIGKLDTSSMRIMRRKMQIIFQDPYASLNPRMTVRSILEEPLRIHRLCTTAAARQQRLYTLLDYVQLPKEALRKYPHEFSGGQRQRIVIARALAVHPQFIVCDESVSALDVSIQAQVINLLMDLQKELRLTYLFIAHDLKVVEFISHRVAVMYLGKILEVASSQDIYKNPLHPYTKALLSAVPVPDPTRKREHILLQGDVPSAASPPMGCHFHPRCWKTTTECTQTYPMSTEYDTSHTVCCHNVLCQKAIQEV
mmetsp:Transcript_6117/g.13713  ORF Transcript_6117/g.13713 Transcript_6117/m.13713 type:complete len:335 (+) Transcript_6117:7938-8942(+)